MRKRELDKYKKLLEERREQLVEQSNRLSGEGRSTISQGGDDYIDHAVTHYTREFLLSLSDLDRRQLMMVDEALARIADGDFGECMMCGEKINTKRLGAVPWARFCVSCQELAERQELSDVSVRDFGEEEEESATPPSRAGGEEE